MTGPVSKAARLQRAALALLDAHEERGELPTSVRFLFYEAEHAGVVRKSRPGETRRTRGWPAGEQDLTDALMRLREGGLVPWSWIVDESREVYSWRSAPTIHECLLDALDEARIDPWPASPAPLLLCESRTVGGVLSRTLGPEYDVKIAPTNGQAGGFLRTDVAPALVVGEALRPVLYVGDLDLAGDAIEANARDVLEREIGDALDWRRVAVTPEQVAAHDLEPITKLDRRYRPAREHEAVEVEALGQGVVVALVRAALDALLPEPLAHVLEREAAEREEWRRRFEAFS